MRLTRDPAEIARLLKLNAREESTGTVEDAAEWLANPANFALVEGDDLSLFSATGDWPGPLTGHIFFASRGRKAEQIARRMLGQAFDYGATEILGETTFRDTALFARRIGFRQTAIEYRDGERTYLLSLQINNFRRLRMVA